MEATELGSGSTGQRHGRGSATIPSWIRPIISRTAASAIHWSEGTSRLCVGRFAGRWIIGAADFISLRGGRCLSASANSLDVVASRWRTGDWRWGFGFSPGAWRGLRHDRPTPAGQRDRSRDSWRLAGEMVYLGGLAGFWNIRRSFGAATDDGRSAGRPRVHDSAQ